MYLETRKDSNEKSIDCQQCIVTTQVVLIMAITNALSILRIILVPILIREDCSDADDDVHTVRDRNCYNKKHPDDCSHQHP